MRKPKEGPTSRKATKRLAKKALTYLPRIKEAIRFSDTISREMERTENQHSNPLIDRFNHEVDDVLGLLKLQQNAPPAIGWTVITSQNTQRKYMITSESNGKFQLHSALQVGQLEIDIDDIETIAEFNRETYNAIRSLHMKAFPEES